MPVVKKYYHDIDLDNNQLISAVIENRTSAPATAVDGQVYYNTVDKKIYFYNSNSALWSELGAGGSGSGSVTSVDFTAPTGFSVTGSPITTSGTLALSFESGYSLPTTASQTNWDTAYGWGNHASAGYQVTSEKGVANGYASLDGTGRVPSGQLPSYVDDVLEYTNLAGFPPTGETGKIYVALDTNKIYRWSGSAYIEIQASPGTTDSLTEGTTNLYFTNARARAAISLTTTGSSGSATYSNSTGVLNIPTYTLLGLGGQPLNTNLNSISGLSYVSASFVKMTAAGTFSLDTNTYLTSAVSTINFGTTGLTPSSATSGAVTVAGTLVGANGGTGQSTYAIGDILYASAATTLSKLAGVATGNALISGGVTTAPSWGKIGLTTHISGTLAVGNGGTGATTLTGILVGNGSSTVTAVTGTALQLLRRNAGDTAYEFFTLTSLNNPMTTLGDIIYGGASGSATRLAGNITATKQFLSQTGTGSVSDVPSWSTVSKTDVGLSNVENTALSTWAGSSNITTLGTIATGTWSATTIAVNKGGTGATTLTGVLIGNGASAFTAISSTTALQVFRVNAAGNGYEFATVSTGGITSIGTSGNGQTGATQVLATGTSGTDFNISSATNTHTFNIPDAGASARGLVTTGTQTFAGDKTFNGSVTLSGITTSLGGGQMTIAVNSSSQIASQTILGASNILVLHKSLYNIAGTTLNANAAGIVFYEYNRGTAYTTASSGAHNLVAYRFMKGLVVNANATTPASVTNYATLYIEDAGTGTATITNNYAIWVDNGTVRFDSAFELQGIASATSANMLYYDSTTKRVTYGAAPTGSGSVSTVSVVSANGFAGTVATATTTPAITLTTTVTGLLKGNGTAISAAVGNTDYLTVDDPLYTGTLSTGSLSFGPQAANPLLALESSVNSYNQSLIQNSSAGTQASSDIIVNNDQSTDTTFYGDFGINSSNYTGSGSLSIPNAVYLYSADADLVFGTIGTYDIHFFSDGSTTDSMLIKSDKQIRFNNYTSLTSYTGTLVGYLGFDSSGNILTTTPPAYSVISVSSLHNENATSGTKIIKADTTSGGFTINLPTAVGNTATIIIKKVGGTANLTIDAQATQTIDGGLTAVLRQIYESITLVSDNANWQIV